MFEFLDFDYLTDGEIDLIIDEKIPTNTEKGFVPAYAYKTTLHDSITKIGEINIRIGNNSNLYYAGHIGYEIDKEFRGKHYAAKACEIIK